MVQLVRHGIAAWPHECAQQLLLDAASMEVSDQLVPARQCLVGLQDLTHRILNVLQIGPDLIRLRDNASLKFEPSLLSRLFLDGTSSEYA